MKEEEKEVGNAFFSCLSVLLIEDVKEAVLRFVDDWVTEEIIGLKTIDVVRLLSFNDVDAQV